MSVSKDGNGTRWHDERGLTPRPLALEYMVLVLILVATEWSLCRPNHAQTYARHCSVSSFLFFFLYLFAYLSNFLCGQRIGDAFQSIVRDDLWKRRV
jgi:hypothetical protein